MFLVEDDEAGRLIRRFGIQIRKARLRARLTQDELAEMLGSSQNAMSRIENGIRGPTLAFCAKLANACGARFDIKLVRVVKKTSKSREP